MSRGEPMTRGEVVVYEAPDGEVRVDVRLERDTVWPPLGQMAELVLGDKPFISRHLRSVFPSGELDRGQLLQKMQQLRPTARPSRLSTSTSMPSSRGLPRQLEVRDPVPSSERDHLHRRRPPTGFALRSVDHDPFIWPNPKFTTR